MGREGEVGRGVVIRVEEESWEREDEKERKELSLRAPFFCLQILGEEWQRSKVEERGSGDKTDLLLIF